jgi:hypothetical protein
MTAFRFAMATNCNTDGPSRNLLGLHPAFKSANKAGLTLSPCGRLPDCTRVAIGDYGPGVPENPNTN